MGGVVTTTRRINTLVDESSRTSSKIDIPTPALDAAHSIARKHHDDHVIESLPQSEIATMLRQVMDKESKFNFKSYYDTFSPIFAACYYGIPELLVPLLHQDKSLLEPDAFGLTAIHIAAYKGHAAIVKILLEAGAPVDGGQQELTPLVLAAQAGNDDVVEILLKHGADVKLVIEPELLTIYDIAVSDRSKQLIYEAQESRGLGICSLCWEQPVNGAFLFVPCGHTIVCKACNSKLIEKNIRHCPICRSLIWCRMSGNKSRISYC